MDGSSDDILADATFAAQKHRGISLADLSG
jgi:hypothetical protein